MLPESTTLLCTIGAMGALGIPIVLAGMAGIVFMLGMNALLMLLCSSTDRRKTTVIFGCCLAAVSALGTCYLISISYKIFLMFRTVYGS